ncbi:MAG: squalene/phytoene synthase family protein [Deltaproteobacteria bacterium]|nr:squalene/phytoene synthase family protein [Deltaproteobacteria bacterium]
MTSLDELMIKASRTFALTIPLLEEPLRRTMSVAYLLMRNADTLEDAWRVPKDRRRQGLEDFVKLVETRDVAAATEWIEQWRDDNGFDDPDHHEVLLETPRLLQELVDLGPPHAGIVASHVIRVASRMSQWVARHDDAGRLSLGNVRELDDYCYAVAGIVGEMITELVGLQAAELPLARLLFLRSVAVDFGAGLQLTNIVKDSWRDAQEGRHYVPQDFLPGPDGAHPERLRPIVLLALARLDQGIEYTCSLPRAEKGVRLFCLLPLVLAAATLREVHENTVPLWRGEDVKISREEVVDLLGASHRAVDDNEAVRDLWGQLTAPLRRMRQAMSA